MDAATKHSAASWPPAHPTTVVDENTRYLREVRILACRMAESVVHAAINASAVASKPVDMAKEIADAAEIIEKALFVPAMKTSH